MGVKDTTLSSDPLPNPRHEAFAREIASGRNATQAYRNVYGTENCRVASTGGHRLLRRKCVAARIKSIQQVGAAGVALNLQEIHDFLTRVVRTPAGQVVPSSDLCTRIKHTRDGATDVWMPDKLACLRLSAKLQGFLDSASPARTASAQSAKPTQSDPPKSSPPDTPPILTEERRQILIARRRAAIQAHKKQAEEQPLAAEKETAEEQRRDEEKGRREVPSVHPAPVQRPVSASPVPPGPTRPGFTAHPYFGQAFRNRSNPEPGNAGTTNASQQRPSFSRVTPDSSSQIVII
jgi:hypothetical protein